MNRKRWFALFGAVGAAAAAAGCKDQPVRNYLGSGGEMVQWQKALSTAVCQLEVANPAGLDPAKRICPNGEGGGGDKTPPPTYPPHP